MVIKTGSYVNVFQKLKFNINPDNKLIFILLFTIRLESEGGLIWKTVM